MSLYVVVHHQQDANQPWKNSWLSDELLEAILTTNEIGTLCRSAKAQGERVFVHRCGSGDSSPIICCSAEVDDVDQIDEKTALVRFTKQQLVNTFPPRTPVKGQNSYLA